MDYYNSLNTTGGPNYDERLRDSEIQRNIKPYGEEIKTTGGPNYDERMKDSEIQRNINPYGKEIKTTGGPNYDERMKDSELQVKMAIERDKDKILMLNQLLTSMPQNKTDLIFCLESIDYRLDFLKKLVEHYRDQVLSVASQYKEDYSIEASNIVNEKVTQYLCLLETLKTQGYNFGSVSNSYTNNSNYYDPNKPEVQLEEIMSIMHVRRKNDAEVQIVFPIDYDLNNEMQQKADAVSIINSVNEHLKNNPYMSQIWKKIGYKFPEDENENLRTL